MENWIADSGLAIAVFAATNIDDIFVLLAFFSDRTFRAHQVVIGQYLGIALLVAASVLIAQGALLLPQQYVPLLGIAPVLIGLKKLWDLRGNEPVVEAIGTKSAMGTKVLAVALVTIANGGDNIGVYAPIFATRSMGTVALYAVIFAVLIAVWLGAAYAIVNHPALSGHIRRHGPRIVPWVLIAIGAFILVEGEVWALL